MKKFIMVVVALLYSFISVNMVFATADTWTQKADFGGSARIAVVGFSIDSKGYIGGGLGYNGILKDFWEYDPASDAWTQKADLLVGLWGAQGFSIGSKGYVGIGFIEASPNVQTNIFMEYDPALNIWTQKADAGGGERSGAVGFSIGNKGYIGTGSVLNDTMKDFWEYDPATNTWTRKADFGGRLRVNAGGFSIGNKGYIGGGIGASDSDDPGIDDDFDVTTNAYKDFWEYDPAIDTWTRRENIGGAGRQDMLGFSISNKGYFYGGIPWSGLNFNNNEFWEYDPAADTWTRKADFGGGVRVGATGFSIGNKGYIGTGLGASSLGVSLLNDLWEYGQDSDNNIFMVPVADKYSLWPPNNKMVPVTIWANVSSSAPVTLTVQVSCNESAKRGTDWTEPVINQATGVISLSLRATRAGSGTGRTYTITITATDANGNSATETVDIVVPHDQGK